MQFILIAYDGTDAGALDRRLAVRAAHLESAQKLVESGNWLYAAGILDDGGKMIGSMIVCDYPSRQMLEEDWLKHEPYVTGNVWEKITIQQANVPPFLLKTS